LVLASWLYISSRSTTTSSAARHGCDVTIASPAHHLEIAAGGSLSVVLTGRARACPTGTVTLTASVNGGGTTQLGTATAVAGAWSYTATVADQATTVITASMTGAGVTKTDRTEIVADTNNPGLTITAPTLTAGGLLYVVCGEDGGYGQACNLHVQGGEHGYNADADVVAPGGQVDLDLTITGANPGALTVSQDGTQKISYAIASDPAHLTAAELGVLSLDEGWTGGLTISVTGPAGATQRVIPTMVKTVRPLAVTPLPGVPHGFDGGSSCPDSTEKCEISPLPAPGGELSDFGSYCRPASGACTPGVFDAGTSDALLCSACRSDAQCGSYGLCWQGQCLTGCGMGPYPDGGAWTHVTNYRHADITFAFLTPDGGLPPGGRVELLVSNSSKTDLGTASRVTVSVGTTPTIVDATPNAHRVLESLDDGRNGSDGIAPTSHAYCALNDPNVTPATGVLLAKCAVFSAPYWNCNGGITYGAPAFGTVTVLTSTDHVYCVADTGTITVGITQKLAYSPSEAMANPALHKTFDPLSPRGVRWGN